MPVNFVEEEAPPSKVSFTPEEEPLTPEQAQAGIEFATRQGAEVPGKVVSLLTNPAVAAASEEGRRQIDEERRQRLLRELPAGGITAGAPPLIEPDSRQAALDAITGAVGAGAVGLADIPTRISNIGIPPGAPGYTPLMTEKPRPALPKPELTPLEQELTKTATSPFVRALPVTSGLTRAVSDVGTGFIQPEAGLTLPFLGGGGGIGRAAAILFGSQQLAEMPRQIQEAVTVLNDPNATAQDKTEALARPGVSALLSATMLKHGIMGEPRPAPAPNIRRMKRAKVVSVEPQALPPIPPEAPKAPVELPATTEPTAPAPVPPVVRDVPAGSVDPNAIVPAIRLIGGEVIQGNPGETHPDIIAREGIKAEDIDQRGFSDPTGQKFFLDREAAAKGTEVPTEKEPGRLHSTDLPAAKEPAAPEDIVARRVKEGIPPENIQITVNRIPELPAADFAQVDEVDPSKPAGQANIFSTNADVLRSHGYDIPTNAELKTLPAGKYTLKEALDLLKKQKEAATPPAATKPPEPATVEPTPAPKAPESVTAVTEEKPDVLPIMPVVERLSTEISNGTLTKDKALEIMAEHHGGTMAQGKFTAKDMTDAVEMAVNHWIRKNGINPSGADAAKAIRTVIALKRMQDTLPTQTTRSAEMDRLQQFSTPPAHSYVVNWVANLTPADTVMEPSTGVGGIAVFAKNAGATVIANELSKRRAGLLQQLGIADSITNHNAELIHAMLEPSIKSGAIKRPTVVVMNPPFSNAATTEAKDTFVGAKHVESALKTLVPGGRLVAIVGEGMAMQKPAFVQWWRKIAKDYTIRANIGISGKEYAKYGTHFGNQIIIIDKAGPTKDLGEVVTGKVEKVEDLIPLLERIKNDRPTAQQAPAQPSIPVAPGPGGAAPGGQLPANVPARPGTPGPVGPAGGTPRPAVTPGQSPTGLVPVAGTTGVSPEGAGGGVRPSGPAIPATPTTVPVSGGVPTTSGVGESGLTLEQREAGEHELVEHGVFSEYRPKKVQIKGSKPHATPLVETTAMASVEPVDPNYVPKLPQNLIESGALSDVQLEQVVYAGQAHEQILPNGQRMGYFIGDGTGVGKGRTQGGIILDQWNRGKKKHVWVSVKKDLIKDATRDLTALGFPADKIIDVNKAQGRNLIGKTEGVAFVTYSGLTSKNNGLVPVDPGYTGPRQLRPPASNDKPGRLHLLYDWLGPDFDGVITFDEAHKAGNAIDIRGTRGTQEASQTGLTVLDIQALFPKARIVYSSATGASTVTNLSYADRLGIWGEGTPWPDKASFFQDIQAGGLSAMEIVARDLKSMGRYLARTLSFEGVTKQQLLHNLTPDQIKMYNQLSDGWQAVLQSRNDTMADTGAAMNGRARGKANSAFYNAQQRFYNQLLTAIQMPTIIDHIRKSLEKGDAVGVSLINTNEATLEREIAAKGVAEGEAEDNWLDDIDLSPKQILLQYIERSYPTQLYQQETDQSGNVRWVPVFQELPDGSRVPVEDPAAVEKKQELLDRIQLLQAPENPLEMILNEFGEENVTEITGRKRRLVMKKQPDGTRKQVLETRNDAIIAKEVKEYEDDKRRILVHSGKGGTGFTFSASNKFINKRHRSQITAQTGWRSDEVLQALGRFHRTDQASAPDYALVSTNLMGQQRFIATIARRLAEMGALTGGERKGAGGDLFSDVNNLESQYAEDAVDMLFRDLHRGLIEGMEFNDISRQLGYTKTIRNLRTGEKEIINTLTDDSGGLNESKIPNIQQFLNRILALRFHDQNNLFAQFMERMEQRVDRAKEDGTFDPGTQTLKADNIKKLEDKVVYQHPSSTAKTRLVEIQYDQKVPKNTFDELLKGKTVVKFVTNIRSGKLYALKEGPNRTLESGTIVPTYRRIGPGGTDLIAKAAVDDFLQGPDAKFQKQSYPTFADAEKAWNEELKKTPDVRTLRDTYVVGAFLPIWDRLQIPDPKIWRITTADKETFLGAHVPPGMVRDVRTRLGAGSGAAASPEAAFNDIIVRGTKIQLANGWELKRSRVQGEPRIEVVGMDYDEAKQFVNVIGGFHERIQFQPRYFIPTDEVKGVEVLTRLFRHSPPVTPDAGPPAGGISEGPGAASPGDVPPPPPPAAGVASQPAWNRANGIVSPTSPGLLNIVKNFGSFLLGTVRGMAGHSFPRTTLADREAGEAMARWAASSGAALRLAKVFSTETLKGTGVDPAKLGEAFVEDNLRSMREGWRAEATQLLADGKPTESAAAKAKADAVVSLVGNQGSHFANEDEYQDFLADGHTQQAIRQHIQQWEEVIDPQFKLAMRIDPDVELPTRGLQTGARVNLKAVFPGETGVNVVGKVGPSLLGTFRRKTPFGIRAKGTAQAYEVNYHELMANTFKKQLEIATKNDADNKLVASGNAKIDKPGQVVEVAGERGVPFPLVNQSIIIPGVGRVSQSRRIYVRPGLAREYRTAANVDASFAIPMITPIMNLFNKAALAGLTDFTVHMSNQMTALFNRPISGGLIVDSLLSATGRADVPVTIVKAMIKMFGDHERQLSELAEIGGLREPHTGKNPLGQILAKTDQTTRLLLDDAYQRLVKAGLVPDTETARREYVNAIGQYNKRMQGPLTRFLRETGFGPFVVAGKTFNALGVKTISLSPGAKASNVFAAGALRANMLAKWVGFAVLLGVINYLLTKDKKGGPLGRKGVPLGNLDTGKSDARGRPLSLPLMDLLGLGRGARVTGVKGYVQSKYLGLTDGNAMDAAARDIVNSAVGPAAGPGPRAGFVMATGQAPAINVPRSSPVAAPGQNQTKINIVSALKDANPLVRSVLDLQEGKTGAEAISRQFPRFAMRPGMEGQRAENMPKIVNAAQLKAYTDSLAKQARAVPLNQRWKFIQEKYAQDQITPENKARSIIQLERQGVFRFQ